MAGTAVFVTGFLLTVFLQHAASHKVHVVGDSTGWTVPDGGAKFYSNWAATNRFVVGDSLLFNFKTGKHSVVEVSKESFEKCSADNAIGNVNSTGPAKVKLTSAGEHYYICTEGKHCEEGQKLSITVCATKGAVPPASDNHPPPRSHSKSKSNAAAATLCATFGSIVPFLHLLYYFYIPNFLFNILE